MIALLLDNGSFAQILLGFTILIMKIFFLRGLALCTLMMSFEIKKSPVGVRESSVIEAKMNNERVKVI